MEVESDIIYGKDKIMRTRKNLFTTVLNVLGLSVAFAAFVVILIQVNYDLGYNKQFKDSDRIYRLEGAFNLSDMNSFSNNISRPLAARFANCSPDIEVAGDITFQGDVSFKRSDLENAPFLNYEIASFAKNIIKVLGFEIVAGDTSTFDVNGNVILSESAAKAYFGHENPIGKSLTPGGEANFTIVAVYKDFPQNCFIHNGVYRSLGNSNLDNYSEWSYTLLVKLADNSKTDAVTDMMLGQLIDMYKDNAEITSAFEKAGTDARFLRLTPIHEAHFAKDVTYDWMEKASRSTTFSLLTIAILIIVIAIINFINFSMAAIPLSIKGINTRKVLGETDTSLRIRQIGQAVCISLISLAVALLWLYILSGTSFGGFISGSIAVGDNIAIVLLTAAVAVFTGIAAGIYPALYSTSFPPALVIKGSFSLSPKGRKLRTALVALQYIISLVLIMVALFINVQSSYMKKFDMGYDSNNILTFSIPQEIGSKSETFESMLKENPMIEDVTFASGMIISNGKMGWGRPYKGKQIRYDCFPVDPDFLEFFGMKIVEGRGFVPEDAEKANGTYIFNEAAIATYPEIVVGEKMEGHLDDPADIVGVVKDFNFQPLQYKINPIALYVFGSQPWWPLRFAYVKPSKGADIQKCIEYLTATVRKADPTIREEEINIQFMDQRIGALYQKEDNLGKLILIFCGLSVLISIIGILGLIYFETQFKKREIGVRRVFGSSVGGILKMLNVAYIKIASICFVISVPIAIVIIKMWLKTFTYQAPIPVWIFIVAYLVIIAITILVITLQSLRAASANPVESVRAE